MATEAAGGFSKKLGAVDQGRPVPGPELSAAVNGKALKKLSDEHRPDEAWLHELCDLPGG